MKPISTVTQVTNSMKTVKLNQIVLLFSCFHEKAYLCPRVSVLNDLRFRYLREKMAYYIWAFPWAFLNEHTHKKTGNTEGTWDQKSRIPWSACRSVLWQDTEPQTAPDVLVGFLHGSHHHQCINVSIAVSHFGQKRLLNALNVNINGQNLCKVQTWKWFSSYKAKTKHQ